MLNNVLLNNVIPGTDPGLFQHPFPPGIAGRSPQ